MLEKQIRSWNARDVGFRHTRFKSALRSKKMRVSHVILWCLWAETRATVLVPRRAVLAAGLASAVAAPARADEVPRVELYGDVDRASCQKLVYDLREVEPVAESLQRPICLHIQSYGGEVMPLLHVLDVIDGLRVPLHTYVDGYAASAASLLSVYGARRFMSKRSYVLIHEIRFSQSGTYSQAAIETAHIGRMMDEMRSIYMGRTRLDDEGLDQLMQRDVWLDSAECLSLGVVDAIC